MPRIARCSECKAKLVNEDGTPRPAGTKTCSVACRSARMRRIKKQKARAAAKNATRAELPEHLKSVSEIVTTKEVKDMTHEVMKEEIRPLVRDQMTETVLGSIADLIGLVPDAIEAMAKDIRGEDTDPAIRARAYSLALRYTMGNPSVAPPPTTPQQGGLTVVLGMPRPGDTSPTSTEGATPSDAEELKTCVDCGQEKPLHEMEAESNVCTPCYLKRRELLEKRFPGGGYKQ